MGLVEEIYKRLPEGYEELTGKKCPLNSVCKFKNPSIALNRLLDSEIINFPM